LAARQKTQKLKSRLFVELKGSFIVSTLLLIQIIATSPSTNDALTDLSSCKIANHLSLNINDCHVAATILQS